jgi:DNA invertase Pin-like site-specific DNA recombinase
MRAVIYTRVSSDPTNQGRSVDEQEAECRAVCAREGWDVVRVFTDNDRGASRHSTKERPAYDALRVSLGAGLADVLVMWEGSRAQRDVAAYASLRDLCAARGILYNYSGRTYDLTRTDDRFSTGLDALLAEREADVTRDRVLRAVRANAASGRPHGKLAYGYAREYDDRGTFVRQYPKDDEAEVVRESARRIVAGESLYAIANDLNARGIPAPRGGRWLPHQIKRLVTNPRYIGQRVHRGAVVGEAVWPALLDEATFMECKAIMEDPRRRTVKDPKLRYLLSGTAKCGECGAKMRVIKNRGYNSYACFEKFCTAVRTVHLEEFVVGVALERLSRKDFLDAVAARKARADAGAGGAQDEAKALRERLDGFVEAAAAGQITPAALAKIEARLLPQIDAAEDRAYADHVPAALRKVAGPDIADRWEDLPVSTRREVIDLLMVIKVNRTVRGARFRPERVDIEWKTL